MLNHSDSTFGKMIKAAAFRILYIQLLIGTNLLLAQNYNIDSLRSLLAAKPHDTSWININNELSFYLLNTNTDSALNYANLALAKSEKLGFKSGRADALRHIAQAYTYSGQYGPAKHSAIKANAIYQQLNNIIGQAETLNQLGIIEMYLSLIHI